MTAAAMVRRLNNAVFFALLRPWFLEFSSGFSDCHVHKVRYLSYLNHHHEPGFAQGPIGLQAKPAM
jgi:hypothetical protein